MKELLVVVLAASIVLAISTAPVAPTAAGAPVLCEFTIKYLSDNPTAVSFNVSHKQCDPKGLKAALQHLVNSF